MQVRRFREITNQDTCIGIRPANLPAMTSSLYNRQGRWNNDMCAAYSPRSDCRTVSSNQYVLKMCVAAVFPTEPNPCLRGCGAIKRTVLNATVSRTATSWVIASTRSRHETHKCPKQRRQACTLHGHSLQNRVERGQFDRRVN